MEEKELTTSGKITQSLIGYWFLWGIAFGIIYSIIYALITAAIDSLIVNAIIAIILQGVMVFFVWKFSISSTFKKKTMSLNDVSIVMKNLTIFTVVVCILSAILKFADVNTSINQTINNNTQIQLYESMMSNWYTPQQKEEYQRQKEEAIEEAKSKAYTYLIVLEGGLTVVYLAVLPFERKEILKYIS